LDEALYPIDKPFPFESVSVLNTSNGISKEIKGVSFVYGQGTGKDSRWFASGHVGEWDILQDQNNIMKISLQFKSINIGENSDSSSGLFVNTEIEKKISI
jgi:hypothetical protein